MKGKKDKVIQIILLIYLKICVINLNYELKIKFYEKLNNLKKKC